MTQEVTAEQLNDLLPKSIRSSPTVIRIQNTEQSINTVVEYLNSIDAIWCSGEKITAETIKHYCFQEYDEPEWNIFIEKSAGKGYYLTQGHPDKEKDIYSLPIKNKINNNKLYNHIIPGYKPPKSCIVRDK